jgi:hypothetical protein
MEGENVRWEELVLLECVTAGDRDLVKDCRPFGSLRFRLFTESPEPELYPAELEGRPRILFESPFIQELRASILLRGCGSSSAVSSSSELPQEDDLILLRQSWNG